MEIGKDVSRGKGNPFCCHVYWISEYPAEREVLLSRHGDFCWQLREKEGESDQKVQRFQLEKHSYVQRWKFLFFC